MTTTISLTSLMTLEIFSICWTVAEVEDWNPTHEPREVGAARAGRLMAVQGGGGIEHTLGVDVGYGGGAASAEEAAMHIISDEDDDLTLLER